MKTTNIYYPIFSGVQDLGSSLVKYSYSESLMTLQSSYPPACSHLQVSLGLGHTYFQDGSLAWLLAGVVRSLIGRLVKVLFERPYVSWLPSKLVIQKLEWEENTKPFMTYSPKLQSLSSVAVCYMQIFSTLKEGVIKPTSWWKEFQRTCEHVLNSPQNLEDKMEYNIV